MHLREVREANVITIVAVDGLPSRGLVALDLEYFTRLDGSKGWNVGAGKKKSEMGCRGAYMAWMRTASDCGGPWGVKYQYQSM